MSSPAATLKASSTRQPTAMRTALEECISFHTVSLSTCGGRRAGFSVPPAGGGQEWGWAPGQWASSHGRQERGRGARAGSATHPSLLAGALLTPMPPQGSTAYIFWLMGPARKRDKATLQVASTAKTTGWGLQRAVSSVPKKEGQTQAQDRPLLPTPLGRCLSPILGQECLTSGQMAGRKEHDGLGRRPEPYPIPKPDQTPSTLLQCSSPTQRAV